MLRSPLVVCWSQAAVVAVFLLAPPRASAAPPPPPRPPHVQALVSEAEAAFDRLDIARARDLWAQIYDLEKTTEWATVGICQLGQIDRRLWRWVDAVDELTQCVQQMRPPATPRERALYETRHADLATARQRVGEIRVFAPAGAKPVLVGGRLVDKDDPIYVAPGQHEVTAVLPDGRMARSTVQVSAGERRAVVVGHEPAGPRPVAPRPAMPAVAPARPRTGPAPWLVYAGLGTSGAFLASGIALHIVASLEDSALRDAMCKPHSDGEYKEGLRTEQHAVELKQHLSTAALIAGTALGAATIIYAVLPNGAEVRASAAGAEVRFSW
ncbi:hypothetical protein [Sorangium cellulosum]|uniref:PEGA domain-containing protein n=1 Tax=Sorangium cellulosum So0157-2 TaxID=1254432 RepID=S4Y227_SORCE|nr:hypothetical protein [Sorangium cellulosum]AGP38849.1 hypothetical protein SCE1572_32800 [Sorangium cellulosum So0157-2]